jgi:hypothetical protein
MDKMWGDKSVKDGVDGSARRPVQRWHIDELK